MKYRLWRNWFNCIDRQINYLVVCIQALSINLSDVKVIREHGTVLFLHLISFRALLSDEREIFHLMTTCTCVSYGMTWPARVRGCVRGEMNHDEENSPALLYQNNGQQRASQRSRLSRLTIIGTGLWSDEKFVICDISCDSQISEVISNEATNKSSKF